jgi:translation initiation factor 2 subunit 2
MDYNYDKLLERARSQIPREILEQKRFDIPDIELYTVGRKTIIQNFRDVAGTLNRTPHRILKYVTKGLATGGNLGGSRAILNGRFPQQRIADIIKDYAKEYVFCHECGKHDTHIIKHGRVHMLKCDACGARSSIRAF